MGDQDIPKQYAHTLKISSSVRPALVYMSVDVEREVADGWAPGSGSNLTATDIVWWIVLLPETS